MQRFWDKVEKTDSCWNWIGAKDKDGYGHFKLKDKNMATHRFVYELIKGKISHELEIDHLCRNRKCVNPNHMEPVTHKINIQRGDSGLHNALKTHCPQGHEYNKENTMFYRNLRKCRVCHKLHCKNWRRLD